MFRLLLKVAKAVLLITAIVPLSACDGATTGASTTAATSNSTKGMATVYGYNYTDLYIDSFSVDGQGGGNLELADASAGGGKHVCCVRVYPEIKTPIPVMVRWTRDRKRWCELEVMLNGPIPPNPEYFEVHFYQDGHVEVAVTEKASAPRVKNARFNYAERHEAGNVNNDAKFARCTNGN